jgi:hypothetical protein
MVSTFFKSSDVLDFNFLVIIGVFTVFTFSSILFFSEIEILIGLLTLLFTSERERVGVEDINIRPEITTKR